MSYNDGEMTSLMVGNIPLVNYSKNILEDNKGENGDTTNIEEGEVVDETTLDPDVAIPAFENVNDKTNEGLEYVGKKIFTVQFHPEACAGPQDTGYLFDRFMDMMKED